MEVLVLGTGEKKRRGRGRNESTSFTRKYVAFRSTGNKVNVVKDTQFVRDKKESRSLREKNRQRRNAQNAELEVMFVIIKPGTK